MGGGRGGRYRLPDDAPLLGVVGWIGKAVRGRRYGIWSMDLHPDAEVAAGMLRAGGFVARILNWLNDRGYRHADFVVDLGPYMRRANPGKRRRPDRVPTVPVWGAAPADMAGLPRPRRRRVTRCGRGSGLKMRRW